MALQNVGNFFVNRTQRDGVSAPDLWLSEKKLTAALRGELVEILAPLRGEGQSVEIYLSPDGELFVGPNIEEVRCWGRSPARPFVPKECIEMAVWAGAQGVDSVWMFPRFGTVQEVRQWRTVLLDSLA